MLPRCLSDHSQGSFKFLSVPPAVSAPRQRPSRSIQPAFSVARTGPGTQGCSQVMLTLPPHLLVLGGCNLSSPHVLEKGVTLRHSLTTEMLGIQPSADLFCGCRKHLHFQHGLPCPIPLLPPTRGIHRALWPSYINAGISFSAVLLGVCSLFIYYSLQFCAISTSQRCHVPLLGAV